MKKWCQVIRSAAPVTQNQLSKPTDLMLQNATPRGKSAPWPPNISHEHFLCTAPATENASLQILFKCPTPAIVFGNSTKPSRFAHFWQGAQSLVPAMQNELGTSKSGPKVVCFVHVDLEMCFAPQRRALFRHRNFQKWSEPGVLCTFWLGNVLRATTACTFATPHLSKVVRQWCALCILTWKCASRHNGVQFFISHLASWLRTRRFSKPTFRPSGATNHWKNRVFRDFPTFSRICIFFLLTLSLLPFSLLIFIFSLPLPCSAFQLSILSEVWLLNFLRLSLSLYILILYTTYIFVVKLRMVSDCFTHIICPCHPLCFLRSHFQIAGSLRGQTSSTKLGAVVPPCRKRYAILTWRKFTLRQVVTTALSHVWIRILCDKMI